MYKDRYFPLFSGFALLLLLACFLPLSFDNNDDQYLCFMSAGIGSGKALSELLLSHRFIGILLQALFSVSDQFNWYSAYLVVALAMAGGMLCFILCLPVHSKRNKFLIILLVIAGFILPALLKLQFTSIALLCGFSALLLLQSTPSFNTRLFPAGLLILLALLIRMESAAIFLCFLLPLFLYRLLRKNSWKQPLAWMAFVFLAFVVLQWVNARDEVYRQQHTYTFLRAQDRIAAKPIHADMHILHRFGYTLDDITLLQHWFPADKTYLQDPGFPALAGQLSTCRDLQEMKTEWVKLLLDERYMVLLALLSFFALAFFAPPFRLFAILNGAAAILLFGALIACSRLPHRLSYPVLAYLALSNLFCLLQAGVPAKKRNAFFAALLLLAAYKTYCMAELCRINLDNHKKFDAYRAELSRHPDKLFIALYDGFPVEWMDARMPPAQFRNTQNLLLTCWYAYSPAYRLQLDRFRLADLSAGLKGRDNVYLLTDSGEVLQAYVGMMQQRHGIRCHFEDPKVRFQTLHPHLLVFDQDASTAR